MENWYYALNGAQTGPVSQENLTLMLSSGQLPPDSLVWCTGMAEWVAAHTVPELKTDRAQAVQPVLGYGVGDSAYQHPPIHFRYAGFWIRFAALFIDWIIVIIAGQIVETVLSVFVSTGVAPSARFVGIHASIGGFAGIITAWLYAAFTQSSAMQGTVGMMALGLRVTNFNGNKITFGRATGRYFASYISRIILGIGYLMMLWSNRKQTLHDLIANTLVVYK